MNVIKKYPSLVFGLTLTLVFLLLVIFRVAFLDILSLKLYDTGLKLKPTPAADGNIVIVDIDDDSIDKLGRWPWPRTRIAECLNKIQQGMPSVIGLNIIYSEPEENAGLKEIERLETLFKTDFIENQPPGMPDTGAASDASPANSSSGLLEAAGLLEENFMDALQDAKKRLDRDSILATAINDADRLVLPIFFKDTLMPAAGRQPIDPALRAQTLGRVTQPPGSRCHQADQATLPIPIFRNAADGMGHINCAPDYDGTYRRERLIYNYRDVFIPSYALVLAARHLGIANGDITAELSKSLHLGRVDIPMTEYSEMMISFRDPDEAFKHYSFFDVINDKIPSRVFTGKIVLISLSAKGLATPLSTPVTPSMSFGAFTGNVLSSILSREFIHELPYSRLAELLAILILGAMITFLFPRTKAVFAGSTFVMIVFVMIGGALFFLAAKGLWIDVVYPLLLVIFGYIGIVTINYFVAETGKEKVEGESAETNRMLGISFQSQGMLDMAFDKFRKVPMDDEMKDLLYNLGLDYERKRQLNKAASVYGYIEQYDAKFKDVTSRKQKLLQASDTMVFGDGFLGGGSAGDGLVGTDSDTRPTLGRYEVQKQLGKGAMGIVYLGQDPRINRTTAIKTVRFSDDFEEDEAVEMKKKFFREAESAGTLSHPNIVTIYDAGEEQDMAYIAMEYLDGVSMEKHAKPKTLLPMRRIIGYMADIAEALDYAHNQGIVHRDIKPANIMLVSSGKIKITDFGIARITASSQTKTGIVKGTPYYMSPEQISGKKVDGRSDIFSLGVMMYQLLTGDVPFKGSSPAALMHNILNEPHPDPRTINPKIPRAMVAIINKAMEKDVANRYQTAGKMAAHLKTLGAKFDAAMQKKRNSQ
ncbi:MAG: serine/threonine-protein kinase [Thermodesulfobacteriota bacterium]|nr:serine/threonine-protein kinase [Thermodesulfobacteriota bacterium]